MKKGSSHWKTSHLGMREVVQSQLELEETDGGGYHTTNTNSRLNVDTPQRRHTLTTAMATPLFFSTFEVTRQTFYRTALTYAIVNLKPIVPGRTCAATVG